MYWRPTLRRTFFLVDILTVCLPEKSRVCCWRRYRGGRRLVVDDAMGQHCREERLLHWQLSRVPAGIPWVRIWSCAMSSVDGRLRQKDGGG